jgi:uncharacterized protein YbjT (DUF2867 family)
MSNTAVIAGASGLIGSKLLNTLLHEPYYDEVLILVRKALPVSHKKLVQMVVNFDELESYDHGVTGHAVFCCLGSTKKKTPDLAMYRKIDHDYPLKLAQIAKQNNVEQYHLVSAIGANSHSSNFYTKMKGETEEAIEKVGLQCLHIYQPSVLTGERQESRPLERFIIGLMKVIDPLLIGGLKKYRSISAAMVARAMYNESIKKQEGVFVHASDKIKLLA